MKRRATRQIQMGPVPIGEDAPIAVQSMTTTYTRDVQATVAQIHRLEEVGCELIRAARPGEVDVQASVSTKRWIYLPLIVDIHYNGKLALLAIEQRVDAMCINPGNLLGGPERRGALMGSSHGVCPRSTYVPVEKHTREKQTRAICSQYTVLSTTVTLSTEEVPHFFDLTDVVQALVEQSDIRTGTALVFSKHTMAAIAIIEHEPLLLDDIAEMLWHLIPLSSLYRYRHDDFSVRIINMTEGEPKNGHAHCQYLFIGASCHLPVIEGSLELGQWQRIFLVELDRTRTRQVVIQVSGVAEHS